MHRPVVRVCVQPSCTSSLCTYAHLRTRHWSFLTALLAWHLLLVQGRATKRRTWRLCTSTAGAHRHRELEVRIAAQEQTFPPTRRSQAALVQRGKRCKAIPACCFDLRARLDSIDCPAVRVREATARLGNMRPATQPSKTTCSHAAIVVGPRIVLHQSSRGQKLGKCSQRWPAPVRRAAVAAHASSAPSTVRPSVFNACLIVMT